jgi:hypothetical protein
MISMMNEKVAAFYIVIMLKISISFLIYNTRSLLFLFTNSTDSELQSELNHSPSGIYIPFNKETFLL